MALPCAARCDVGSDLLRFRTRALFAVVSVIGAVAVCACSLLYENYDDRFQSTNTTTTTGDGQAAFLNADGSITEIAVAAGDVYFAVGNEISRVPEDGGAPHIWWSGYPDAAVVSLASNGTDVLIWGDGAPTNSKNSVFVSAAGASSNATEVESGQIYGNDVAAGSVIAWSLGTNAMGCTTCPLANIRPSGGGAQTTLTFVPPPSDPKTAVATHALSVDSTGVDVLLNPGRFMRFGFAGNVLCSNLGFTPTIAGLAAGANGSPTFVLSGSSSTVGALVRYDSNCPNIDDGGGISLASDVVKVSGDDTAVYWSSSTGGIFREAFDDDAGKQLGSAHAAPAALAVSDSWIYAAVSSSIFRFAKTP